MSIDYSVFPKFSKQNLYVENWYPVLSDHTFKTWIFHFTPEEGDLLHQVVRAIYRKDKLSEEKESFLNQFRLKVSDFFDNVKKESPPNSGYFLRLGSRSLKDGVFECQYGLKRIRSLLYEKYLSEYKKLQFETKSDKISWVNQKSQMSDFFIMIECDNKTTKCDNISDMFDLFLHSERILTDLFHEKSYESPKFSLNFRLWDDRLKYPMEFRGFVYHHKFCALTQYDNRFYYKKVYENKEKIKNAIVDLYENKVRPKMESNCKELDGTYVMDFGVIFNDVDNKVEEVLVIELNNFLMSTEASMFDWIKDIDVLTGKKDFEFRVVEENMLNDIDYDQLVDSQILLFKNKIKADIVNDNKSFIERYFTWRDDVVPNKVG